MLEITPVTSLAIEEVMTLENETTMKEGSSETCTSVTVGKHSSESSTSVTVGKASNFLTVGKASTSVVNAGINQKLNRTIDSPLKMRLKQKIQQLQSRRLSLEKASTSLTVGKHTPQPSTSVTVGKHMPQPSTSVTVGKHTPEPSTSVTVGNDSSEPSTFAVNASINQKLNRPKDSPLKIRLKQKIQQLQSCRWRLKKTVNKLRLKIPPKVSKSVLRSGGVDAIVNDAKQFLTTLQVALFN